MKKTFNIEVDCPNCAAKVERAINEVEGVIKCSINFIAQKMTLEAEDDKFESVLKSAIKAGKKAESDFSVEE